ncbi:MAG TPA: hypothetical protein VK172_06780 [Lentimicrobium sp.]|nr:hypothetical protein [Lentimicrobium sp.]
MENYSEINENFSKIDDAINNIKQGQAWLSGELGFNVVQQNPDNNVLVVAMHKESEFESFQANNALIVKVIHGKIRFRIKDKITEVESGRMVILIEHTFYLIESIEESVFLLMTFNSLKNNKNYWLC